MIIVEDTYDCCNNLVVLVGILSEHCHHFQKLLLFIFRWGHSGFKELYKEFDSDTSHSEDNKQKGSHGSKKNW